jgi:hypothetical protein
MLQGHTDMVCVKEDDVEIDFAKDPIPIYIDGDFVKARGTSLGADDGHAVAMILALLDNDEPVVEVLVADDEKTKIVTQKPAPKRESNEDKPKQKKSRWWVWSLLLLFIVVLCISLKDLFRGGDNAKEVAKEEKSVEMPAEEVVTTPIESEQFVLNEPAEVEELVPVATPSEDPVSTEAEDPVAEVEAPAAEAEATETSAPYKVGDYYNVNDKKGVVFEVSDDGRHGKIVSLDQTEASWDSRVDWDGANGTKTGANSMSDGKANTDKIMSRTDSEYFKPFVWCSKKGRDWYLPAKEELEAILKNVLEINSTLAEYGGTELSNWYWSSTEDDEFCAWYVDMYYGNTYGYRKDGNSYVRAVSAF